MDDSFIFDGKKYISIREAARLVNYTCDYIGQLCRGKKIIGRMVGRTWYVDQESVIKHKHRFVSDVPDNLVDYRIDEIISRPKVMASKSFFTYTIASFIAVFIVGLAVFSTSSYMEIVRDSSIYRAAGISADLSSAENSTLNDGVVVIPSSGSDMVDRTSVAKIRDSFSDEVMIKPDVDGVSGIITPVFRNSIGDDYFYVMVPASSKK